MIFEVLSKILSFLFSILDLFRTIVPVVAVLVDIVTFLYFNVSFSGIMIMQLLVLRIQLSAFTIRLLSL